MGPVPLVNLLPCSSLCEGRARDESNALFNRVIASTSLLVLRVMKRVDIATPSTFDTAFLGMVQHILANERLDTGSRSRTRLATIVYGELTDRGNQFKAWAAIATESQSARWCLT